MKLLTLAQWHHADAESVLAQQGESQDEWALIYNGEISAVRKGEEIARRRDGTLVGEMSYIGGGGATGTVTTTRETRYLSWPQKDLRQTLQRNLAMDESMQSVFNLDLVRKLGAH